MGGQEGSVGAPNDQPTTTPSLEPTSSEDLALFSLEFSGPLPHPGILAQYNAALPDGAHRVVAMAEQQSAHRHKLESRGQVFGFLVSMTALVGGIVLIALGMSVEGLIPLASAIVGLAGVFIYSEVQSKGAERQLEKVISGDRADEP
jgi:uncharacterized membrane protein